MRNYPSGDDAVVAASVVAALYFSPPRLRDQATGHGGETQPSVLTGSLAWRNIAGTGGTNVNGVAMPHSYQTVVAADLDGDDSDELVVTEYGTTLDILRLDGTPSGSFALDGSPPECAWDCNGDGKQEIIRQNRGGTTQALDMKGKVVQTLPYWVFGGVGDADGDGRPELWVHPVPGRNDGVAALNSQGKFVVDNPQLLFQTYALVCDYDGSGKSACITWSNDGLVSEVSVNGTRQLGSIGGGTAVTGCLDVDGDGRPDLLVGVDGYFDHASASLVPFKAHPGFEPPYPFNLRLALFDLKGDGLLDEVYAGLDAGAPAVGNALTGNGRLRIVEPQTQQVLYDAVLPRNVTPAAAVAQAHGKQYLVVAAGERLLVYP
jgi:hypothetical protein